ncbi:hypothetical protein E0504_34270 [Parafrankia sp. BMG5.11]|nr:hypothetical protein E0504_34270 [Parafrankia sp. BMG5.11]
MPAPPRGVPPVREPPVGIPPVAAAAAGGTAAGGRMPGGCDGGGMEGGGMEGGGGARCGPVGRGAAIGSSAGPGAPRCRTGSVPRGSSCGIVDWPVLVCVVVE